jgi:hypothetical protein
MIELSYSELITHNGYKDRLLYLMRHGTTFEETFGGLRHLNQRFYRSREWKRVRRLVITRDYGCDLAIPGMNIPGPIYVHHINPITPNVLIEKPSLVLDPEFLITTSFDTHQRIHYSIRDFLELEMGEREPGDTKLW